MIVACAALIGAAGGATAFARSAKTTLTIQSSPGGLFGYVKSSDAGRCAEHRKVVVFQQVGAKRDRGADRRIATDNSGDRESTYRWSVETGRKGRFYAEAAKKPGCGAAVSGTVRSLTGLGAGGSDRSDYPACSPYVSEGPGEICFFGQLDMKLVNSGGFGDPSGQEPGNGRGAPFPWGANYVGGPSPMRIYWQPEGSERSVVMVSFWGSDREGNGAAHLGGHIPNASSNRFTVTDAFAQNESGYPNGDHFYTPDLPGQAPGEVGGPLDFNFKNARSGGSGEVWVSGYLYLKR